MTDRSALLDAIDVVVEDLPDVAVATSGPATTWSRGGLAFALLGTSSVELRIGPAVAAAAIRTPDTRAAPRGVDWVEFGPVELDGHALDRLGAWLQLAYRRAQG